MVERDEKSYVEAQGFLNHNEYSSFVREKYSDASVSFNLKNFDHIKGTMRELIDNTYAYLSHSYAVPSKEKEKIILDPAEYFEFIIDNFETIKEMEQKTNLTPAEREIISEGYDIFMKESRKIRRMIMQDLAVSNITPQPKKKKIDTLDAKFNGASG